MDAIERVEITRTSIEYDPNEEKNIVQYHIQVFASSQHWMYDK